MTEAEAKAIETCEHCERPIGYGGSWCRNHVDNGRMVGCYLLKEKLQASRLLAAEAEAGPLEVIHQWARLQPVPIAVDQAMRALDRLRGPVAPPAPPVASEPAQETGGVERVSHEEASVALQAISTRPASEKTQERLELLELYCQQQERSEREAAEAVELMAKEHAAAIRIAADRDAERTQKEALMSELEVMRELETYERGWAVRSIRADDILAKLDALRKQPAEAAPVAKVEAPSEPAGWVPKVGDPVTSWRTPKFGRGVIVAIPSQTLANSVDNCDVEFEDGRVREIWLSSLAQATLEPAPQPPATTGGIAHLTKLADPTPPQLQGDGVELRSQFIDAFCSAENLWTQGKTHEALGRLSTAVAKLAKALGVES